MFDEFVKLGVDLVFVLGQAVGSYGKAQAHADWVRDRIVEMVKQERNPTEEEWARLRTIRSELHEQIQGA